MTLKLRSEPRQPASGCRLQPFLLLNHGQTGVRFPSQSAAVPFPLGGTEDGSRVPAVGWNVGRENGGNNRREGGAAAQV